MTFGEVVRVERMKKGLTQEKLGEMLGVSSQAVSKWETTGCYPDAELLVPLPLLLFAKFVRYNAIFHLQSDNRQKPLIRP